MLHSSPKLVVICGPMFSGKSTALSRYIDRALRARHRVQVFLHTKDTRSKGAVTTHSGHTTRGSGVSHSVVNSSRELYDAVREGTHIIVIEEAQFYDLDLPLYINKILARGIHVVAAGLDLTSEGDPFGPMGHLLVIANTVEKITAICPCGSEATRTLSLSPKTEAVKVGGENEYRAACVSCWRLKGAGWDRYARETP